MNASTDIPVLRSRDARQRLDNAANAFDTADFVHGLTRDGLMQRIRPMTVEAAVVVDLGAATGNAIPVLQKRFRRARIIAVDRSTGMLRAARGKRRLLSKQREVQADARALPFADGSVDVVFCNLLLPWLDRPHAVFAEVTRVLRADGLFAFATLGPDSLVEVRKAWQTVDDGAHVRQFQDMHDVGDALVRAGLRDPVLDVDRLTVDYGNSDALFRDAFVLLNTSESEGFPNAFLQAAKHAVPICSRRVNPDQVLTRHGIGFLAHDSITELSAMVRRIHQQRWRFEIVASSARRYVVRHHRLEDRTRELTSLLDQLEHATIGRSRAA